MLIERIEVHMRRHRMSPSRFGRAAVGDPNFVTQLRHGRTLRSATLQKVVDYLNDNEFE